MIAGDFQSDPDTYQAVVDAKALGHWFDPLVESCEQGETSRPITFSRGSNFKDPTDNFSSIDGILLNDTALSALVDIRVCYEHAKQHCPILASFSWPKIFQKGFVHQKPAAFDLSKIPQVDGVMIDLNPIANKIWDEKHCHNFDHVGDEAAWKIINDFAIDTLQSAGASFGRGPKLRGSKPTFKQVVKCPGQDFQGCMSTKQSSFLSKTFQLVTELRFRLARNAHKFADFCNTWNLQQKVFSHLKTIESCKWWNPNVHLHDDALFCVLSCLQEAIVKCRNKEKRNRIADWKRKMIQGTRSKQVGKFVFSWIKSKTICATPNLIRDHDGNIIVDPNNAIKEINSQWDTVFAANVLHSDPMEVLKFAWPYIQESRQVASIPTLTGDDLRAQALRRKIDAAPGLDGWRTPEMKILPVAVYDVAASYFQKVEQGVRKLPECLVLARQIILDKKGDAPLQKRLISLLPIFLLCYTSLRFRQLQSWQMQQLPQQLFGGIKSRRMSQLQTQLRISLDEAKASGAHLIGVKLDKAKCFDRLVPSIASALMLAFGAPAPVVMVFSQMYANLRRLLSYKSWISTVPTTCANSVIQGCSLSLIAINVHMGLWIKLIDKLPGMFAGVFVDDSYLWTRLDNCRILREAIEVTSNWDLLTGQLANHCKSSAWASNTAGRKILAQEFPEMVHEKVIDVLGARIKTTEQATTAWDPLKTQKILRDLKSIKALPCPVSIKEHIIGCKVSPQLAFTPHLSAVPKKDLKLVQDQLASIIWKNRPMWRCRWLIIALLANPYRSDPFFARAYNSIIETIVYLKHCNPEDRKIWAKHCDATRPKPNSLLNCFRQACVFLGILHQGAFHLVFFDAEPVCFLDFGKKELRNLLKIVVRHQCYKYATDIKRKDLKPCVGYLNFPLTQKHPRGFKNQNIDGLPLTCFWESLVVGCTVTNDRKAKAGFSESPLCRYCKSETESLEHLVDHCTAAPFAESRPTLPTGCGPNFKLLGIVECSKNQAASRLRISKTSSIPVKIWNHDCAASFKQVWTDGSCDNPDLFWESSGGFSIVNENGILIDSGPVCHPSLCSYTCELWSIIWAFCISDVPLECRSDSKTVVDQMQLLISTQSVSSEWMHFEWWCFLKTIFLQRTATHQTPLKVTWIPAHVLEHLPCELISHGLALQHNTTWIDIFCNRRADYFAKKACKLNNPDPQGSSLQLKEQIGKWQHWLALVNAAVSSSNKEDRDKQKTDNQEGEVNGPLSSQFHPNELTTAHPKQHFEAILPKWFWNPLNDNVWIPTIDEDFQISSYASITAENWSNAIKFFRSIKWFLNDNYQTSFIELAYLSWEKHFTFRNCDTPAEIATMIRKCINQASKHDVIHQLIPGRISPKAKSNGKTFPAGFVQGAYPCISVDTLKKIAVSFFNGNSLGLKSWKCF